jgi:uncharacterized membrane protein
MHQIFVSYDKWNGLVPLLVGIYVLLLAYKVFPLKRGNPELSENWHKKYGGLMKIVGPVGIVAGVASLLFAFFK